MPSKRLASLGIWLVRGAVDAVDAVDAEDAVGAVGAEPEISSKEPLLVVFVPECAKNETSGQVNTGKEDSLDEYSSIQVESSIEIPVQRDANASVGFTPAFAPTLKFSFLHIFAF